MRWSIILIPIILLALTANVNSVTPKEYEDMAREAMESGNYATAAQKYDLAAQAYISIGNYTAAGLSYRRSASIYAAIGSLQEYERQVDNAAAAYGRAGDSFVDNGYYLSGAEAYENSAYLYNISNKTREFVVTQEKAGDTYLMSAEISSNLTLKIKSLYRAGRVFLPISKERFQDSLTKLNESVYKMRSTSLRNGDPSIFDVLDLYYLPVFTELLGDVQQSAVQMSKTAELAAEMGFKSYAAYYHTSAAIFYSEHDDEKGVNQELEAAADSYRSHVMEPSTWNYSTYLSLKSPLEESLYIYGYLEMPGRIEDLASYSREKIGELASSMEATGYLLGHKEDYRNSGGNFSAAAELRYVIKNETGFRMLNGIAGSVYRLMGQNALDSGNDTLAARNLAEAGFLLKIAGNVTYQKAYSDAANLYRQLGNSDIVSGNLSSAASRLKLAADYYRKAGNMTQASDSYQKLISVLRNIMEEQSQNSPLILVSIADAQYRMGETGLASETYSQASDQLIGVVSSYLQSSPSSLASMTSLTKGLVKSYRRAGDLFLARRMAQTLNQSYLGSTQAVLATYARIYSTAASIYQDIAEEDLSVFDFRSHTVNELFSGLCYLISGDLERARSALDSVQSVHHGLHSSNRKFLDLLKQALDWKDQANQGSRQNALTTLEEISRVTGDTDMEFMLKDMKIMLDIDHGGDELASLAAENSEEGEWKVAAEQYWNLGELRYFGEDYQKSLSAYEDSSYCYLKLGDYDLAWNSVKMAYECTFSPSDYVLGLRSLSKALMHSNSTLAAAAKTHFEAALDQEYKESKCNDLIDMANDLAGPEWVPTLIRVSIFVLGLVTALGLLLFLRRRREK